MNVDAWRRCALIGALALSSCGQSEFEKFAKNTCNPTSHNLKGSEQFELCVPLKFGEGSQISYLQNYLEGADFTMRNSVVSKGVREDDYVAIQDDKKQIRRKRIIVWYQEDSIKRIQASEWLGLRGQTIPDGY